MTTSPPPTEQPIVTDASGYTPIQWIVFFNQMFNGDAGNAWVPTFQNLTTVGVPKVSGRIYQLSKYLCLFVANIIPATSVSAVAGSSFINNFPLKMSGNGICFAVSGNLGSNGGMCDQASNNIFIPALSGVTLPITIMGIVEAS